MNEQIIVIAVKMQIGKIILSMGNPRAINFKIFIPCVSSNTSTIFSILIGITS